MGPRTQVGDAPVAGATTDDERYPRRAGAVRRSLAGVLAGVVAALGVALVSGFYAAAQDSEWTAESRLLVGPGLQADSASISGYYETLSRGQVTATAAEIVAEPQQLRAAARGTDLPPAAAADARVTVVPGTSLVSVSVTAPRPLLAERFADEVVRESVPVVNALLAPYAGTPLGSAEGSAEVTGMSTPQVAAMIALLAVVAGVAVQQVVHQLSGGRSRPRPT